MSDSSINVTPGSGGPNIDLQIIDNANARQVIVLGDPAAAAKVAPVDATLGLSVNPTALPPNAAKETGGHLAAIDTKTPAQGANTMANSQPVTIASDQPAIEVELFDSAENGITSQANGAQRALDVGIDVAGVQVDPRQIRALTNTDVVKVQLQDNGGTAITLGQKVMASSVPVAIASDQAHIPVELQDGAGVAVTVGQKVSASSLPVVIASNQSAVPTSVASPTIATYTATVTALATAALATDIFTVIGSATKLVKIRRFLISGSQTTAGSVRFITLKRSTADSGNTFTAATAVPHDSADPAATSVAGSYTGVPSSLGTLVGNLDAKSVVIETVATTTDFQGWEHVIDAAIKPVTLHGVNEVWAVNLGGVTVAGSSLNISVVWTEE